jgi:hypothetical protein
VTPCCRIRRRHVGCGVSPWPSPRLFGLIPVPIIWLLISVQFMEILWVVLNYLGIERTTTEKEVRYVGDVHLSFMPFRLHRDYGGRVLACMLIIGKD